MSLRFVREDPDQRGDQGDVPVLGILGDRWWVVVHAHVVAGSGRCVSGGHPDESLAASGSRTPHGAADHVERPENPLRGRGNALFRMRLCSTTRSLMNGADESAWPFRVALAPHVHAFQVWRSLFTECRPATRGWSQSSRAARRRCATGDNCNRNCNQSCDHRPRRLKEQAAAHTWIDARGTRLDGEKTPRAGSTSPLPPSWPCPRCSGTPAGPSR